MEDFNKGADQPVRPRCLISAFPTRLIESIMSKLMSFMNTIDVSNSLDPDQVRRTFGPDLGLNCLPRLSADNTSR